MRIFLENSIISWESAELDISRTLIVDFCMNKKSCYQLENSVN
jgi:hypothetical protein